MIHPAVRREGGLKWLAANLDEVYNLIEVNVNAFR
jgi:hypothetical protein